PEKPPEKPPEPKEIEPPEPPPKPAPPKPVERAKKARKPVPPPEPPRERPPPTPPPAAATEAVAGTVEDPALIEQAKQEYLRRLLAHIEEHKHYPRAARRRGIEGEVEVVFSLQHGGGVSGLKVDGAHQVLLSAASDAVEAAQPLPAPPDSLELPWQVLFTMRFTLR
ncbi:MAG: energy transducer TonB, partial [Gammaproteobacteria bacterium]|nr:energy transducer TonB [Gammaproteobacteria bacterium]